MWGGSTGTMHQVCNYFILLLVFFFFILTVGFHSFLCSSIECLHSILYVKTQNGLLGCRQEGEENSGRMGATIEGQFPEPFDGSGLHEHAQRRPPQQQGAGDGVATSKETKKDKEQDVSNRVGPILDRV